MQEGGCGEQEYQKFLRQMQEIVEWIQEAIDDGDESMFYLTEDIELEDNTCLIKIAKLLEDIGLECTFIGGGMWWIRGWRYVV